MKQVWLIVFTKLKNPSQVPTDVIYDGNQEFITLPNDVAVNNVLAYNEHDANVLASDVTTQHGATAFVFKLDKVVQNEIKVIKRITKEYNKSGEFILKNVEEFK